MFYALKRENKSGKMKNSPELNCIAIDMGASNIRIMFGKIARFTLQYEEVYRFPNSIVEKEGHERWDIGYILHEIIAGMNKACSSFSGEMASIGVDAWGVDFAMLDASGKLMEFPVAYRDKRTEGMEAKWLTLMSREETFQRSGINFYIFNTLFQLLSMKGSEKLAAASRILFLPSFILSRLCGIGINELTISSTSQLLNARSGNWDPFILENLGISPGMLGEVCTPGTILGEVNHPELEMPGTKAIAVCAHDTASAVVSVPFESKLSVFISTGTWCLLGIESDQPILSADALKEGFTNERGYGGSYRFLKNIVGLWLVQGLMKSLPVSDDYDEIESLASNYSGADHIINPDDPVFYNPDNMKEAFDEYFSKTGQELPDQPGGYFRCAYDSLIFSFRVHIELIEKMTGKDIQIIHLIGGGCQSGYLTRQTTAICNRRVVSGPVEAATIGNILVQAIAMGTISDLAAARKLVAQTMTVRTILPDKQANAFESSYSKFLEFRKIQANLNTE
jgi:rhamnulokinase